METSSGWSSLETAISDGSLSLEDLERWKVAVERWGVHLAGLVGRGALKASAADRLIAGAGGEGGTARSSSGGERYELGELLGRGGMGEVYRAYDPGLRRWVAFKLLRRDDEEMVERFLREAQSQARVEHPAVCKVYETGLRRGRPYIAMQLIEGEPLFGAEPSGGRPSDALAALGVEQKVRIMQRVAEGVQAAHREGLIHRDLKPSNVLVERTSDGDWQPTIVDFGLAREVASAGITSLGLAVGTPHFMAPEQARGESSRLDRRTDVYGLGATLFAILAGAPPFEGESSLDVMVRAAEEEAPRLRGVPADLEAIVARCLEKDPARRYGSARQLAEDLGRYLDGQPVLARRVSWIERLWKRARRHRALVAVAGAATVGLLTLGSWSVRAEWRSRERAALAQELGQEVKGMESVMRVAHLLPAHDLTEEKASIRRRMAAIASRLPALGRSSEGPARYALGRGHLALGEAEAARGELERAWAAGYRDPQVAYALGLAMTELYRRGLQELERLPDAAQRESHRRRLQEELREPALRFLESSDALHVESPRYVEAQVAFLEGRYDAALELAEQAWAASPGLYEAQLLAGDAHAELMIWHQDHGEQQAAAERYGAARAAYAEAASVARSDPAPHRSFCALVVRDLQAVLYNTGGDFGERFGLGREACERALTIDPGLGEVHQLLAHLHQRKAEAELHRGGDPLPSVARSVAAADAALAIDPSDARAWNGKGLALVMRAQEEEKRGLDPRATLEAAGEALDRAAVLRPGEALFHSDAGWPRYLLGQYELAHGGDAAPAYEAVVEALSRALAVDPGMALAWSNLSEARGVFATLAWTSGLDPFPDLDAAVEAAERAIGINPELALARANLGHAHLQRARMERRLGIDPEARLAAAEGTLRTAIELNPRYPYPPAQLGYVSTERALSHVARGEDPTESVDRALTLFAESLKVNPDLAYAFGGAADAERILVELDLLNGERPTLSLSRATAWVERILEVNPRSPDGAWRMADLHRLEAAGRLAHGDDPSEPIASGVTWAEKALAANARQLEAYLALARLRILEGRWLADTGGDPTGAFSGAGEVLAIALGLKGDFAEAYLAQAEAALAEALWRRDHGGAAGTLIGRGLEAAGRALEVNPTLADASWLRGRLQLLAAEGEVDPARRRAASVEAARALERAVAGNPLLERQLVADLQRARRATKS